MKLNLFKILRERFFRKPSSTEIILFVLVFAFIVFNILSSKSLKTPIGDFGPTPYDKHNKSLENAK
ncbi:MAG: hypothetical protein WC635_12015 [Bacteriovorax sp.]|jgi:hypothetical protein